MLTASTGSFDVGAADAGFQTLIVRPYQSYYEYSRCWHAVCVINKRACKSAGVKLERGTQWTKCRYSQSSEAGLTAPDTVFKIALITSAGKPVRRGSVTACWKHAGPKEVAVYVVAL